MMAWKNEISFQIVNHISNLKQRVKPKTPNPLSQRSDIMKYLNKGLKERLFGVKKLKAVLN